MTRHARPRGGGPRPARAAHVLGLALAAGAAGALSSCIVDDTYASCVIDGDCRDLTNRCFRVAIDDARGEATSGRFCTLECNDDAACDDNFGFEGACLAIDRTRARLCYQRCEVDRDCWSGSLCRVVEVAPGTLAALCVPEE